jgi:hypothetical protein
MIVSISTDSTQCDSMRQIVRNKDNNIPQLAPKKKIILHYIAQNGKSNIYSISEDCEITYSTAHVSIQSLQKEGFVRLESRTKNVKKALTTIYGLTAKGVYQTIFDLPTWKEKIIIVEKWQHLLNPHVLEWMKFIGDLNDKKTEEQVNSQIGYDLTFKPTGSFIGLAFDFGPIDIIDETFFEATVSTMMIFPNSAAKILSIIGNYPRIKKILLVLLNEDIKFREDDLKNYRRLRSQFDQTYSFEP